MTTAKDRATDEYQELGERIEKARTFRDGEGFKRLSYLQRDLLHAQINAMVTYRTILGVRLEHWQEIG